MNLPYLHGWANAVLLQHPVNPLALWGHWESPAHGAPVLCRVHLPELCPYAMPQDLQC